MTLLATIWILKKIPVALFISFILTLQPPLDLNPLAQLTGWSLALFVNIVFQIIVHLVLLYSFILNH